MLEYARWKYILVAVVLLLALLFALPNFFGEDPALQVARKDHNPMVTEGTQALEGFLKQRGVAFGKSYIDSGRRAMRSMTAPSSTAPTSPRSPTPRAPPSSCARWVCGPCPWGSTCAAACTCSTRSM
jgi:preprotein translocase subunit SecD